MVVGCLPEISYPDAFDSNGTNISQSESLDEIYSNLEFSKERTKFLTNPPRQPFSVEVPKDFFYISEDDPLFQGYCKIDLVMEDYILYNCYRKVADDSVSFEAEGLVLYRFDSDTYMNFNFDKNPYFEKDLHRFCLKIYSLSKKSFFILRDFADYAYCVNFSNFIESKRGYYFK